MENIKRISQSLRDGQYSGNPHGASDDLAILGGEYAWVMGQLEDILQRKPSIWNELRKVAKSDTACEKMWEATESGLNEMGLKLRAKGIEKMMSSLKSIIRLSELQI